MRTWGDDSGTRHLSADAGGGHALFRSITTDLESNYYGLAGTIGRGMVMFLGPLVGVMLQIGAVACAGNQ